MLKLWKNTLLLQPALFGIVATGLLLLTPDLAEATRLKKIAGSLSDSENKIQQLKMVGMFAGYFLSISAMGLLFGRKKLELSYVSILLLFILGVGLIILGYT